MSASSEPPVMSEPRQRWVTATGDLLVVGLLATVATATVVGAVTIPATVRVVLGVFLVLLAPGYAFVSLLLPRRTIRSRVHDPTGAAERSGIAERTDDALAATDALADTGDHEVTWGGRLLLSVGLSVVVVPLVALSLEFAGWPLNPWNTATAVGVVTVLLVVVALGRRLRVEADRRVTIGLGRTVTRARGLRTDGGVRTPALTVVLVAGLVLAAATVGVALATTENGERYTEFYLLTESEPGALVADGYPSQLTAGEPTGLHVGISNEEGETVGYTVVVQLQRVDRRGGSPQVTERFGLDSFGVELREGRTIERRHAVEPTVTGEDFRLAYLLYRGEPPETPSMANAYRSVHLWVDVTATEGDTG